MEGKEKEGPGIEDEQTGTDPELGLVAKQCWDRVGQHLFKGKQGDHQNKQAMEHDGIGGHDLQRLKKVGIQYREKDKQGATCDKIEFHPFFRFKQGIEVVNNQQIVQHRIDVMNGRIVTPFLFEHDTCKFGKRPIDQQREQTPEIRTYRFSIIKGKNKDQEQSERIGTKFLKIRTESPYNNID